MFKPLLFTAALAAFCATAQAANLTAQEQRWLHAAAPVLNYARAIKLPVDIIVQPQARAGDVPLAMGFDKGQGRCKLVLSMRGNPAAEEVLAGVPEAERDRLIEAMTAHELAHCWRYAEGAWHVLPAGFVEVGEETAQDPDLLAASKAMRETRREEGFADLVALAWIQRSQPQDYARVHGWLSRVRGHVAVARSSHDTRVWVRLAGDGSALRGAATPFEAATGLWRDGLLQDD